MVTRKPVAPRLKIEDSSDPANGAPPYPITPNAESTKTISSVYSDDLRESSAFDLIDMNNGRTRARRDSDVSSHGTWDSEGSDRENDTPEEEIERPHPLNVRSSQQNLQKVDVVPGKEEQRDELPASLRPGPTNGAIVGTKASENRQYDTEASSNPWRLESNNPYLQRPKLSPQITGYSEDSQKIWEQPTQSRIDSTLPAQPMQAPPQPPAAAPPIPPVELSAMHSPSAEFSRLSLQNRQSAGTATSYETAEVLPVPYNGHTPSLPIMSAPEEGTHSLSSVNPWSNSQEAVAPHPPTKEALSPIHPPQPSHTAHTDLIAAEPWQPEYEAPPGPPPGQALPLVGHTENVRPQPQLVTAQPTVPLSRDSIPETPSTRDRRQRSEHYQIKHIRWEDSASGSTGMRQSPILIQNLNGPCPLLALVNALVLSTPQELDTALIETLRTREQVSLGLLLDAVFDELMSGRRGESAHALPDVTELYSFLLALHTGMNVNPRFIAPVTTPRGSFDGHPSALQSLHPSQRSQHKPGCFEETKEMRLYSTFNIPLIHGWTAPNDTPAYAALSRSAQSFEDAQNIQFAEAELEDKLRTQDLSFQEQQNLEDIHTVKSFLQTWPTQLTDFGLETISTSLKPGQVAILFRNDHFSTLYKEPRHGALMTLVTDAGYSSHEEIVWESLVDVNGAASEMFSGDFRVVSHGEEVRLNQGNSGGGNEGWQTVQSRNRYHRQPSIPQSGASVRLMDEIPPPLPGPRPTSAQQGQETSPPQSSDQRNASEQEDHDLALALQLQEEEEAQHREAETRRRRELELNEQFLSNEEQPPVIPPRRSAGRNSSALNIPVTGGATGRRTNGPHGRLAVNRPGDDTDPDAPPTYEQSSSDRVYRPAGATAPTTQGNPLNALDALTRQQSAYAQQSSTSVNTFAGMPPHNRRRSEGNRLQRRQSQNVTDAGFAPPYDPGQGRIPQAATVRDTDERCVMM